MCVSKQTQAAVGLIIPCLAPTTCQACTFSESSRQTTTLSHLSRYPARLESGLVRKHCSPFHSVCTSCFFHPPSRHRLKPLGHVSGIKACISILWSSCNARRDEMSVIWLGFGAWLWGLRQKQTRRITRGRTQVIIAFLILRSPSDADMRHWLNWVSLMLVHISPEEDAEAGKSNKPA